MSPTPIKVGALRHRICIWQRVEMRDAHGGIDYAWTVFADRVPAAIEPARVISTFGGAQQQENFDVLIRVRFREGLRTTMHITWDRGMQGSGEADKVYEIVGVRTRDEIRHEVFLHCIERQGDGWRKQ